MLACISPDFLVGRLEKGNKQLPQLHVNRDDNRLKGMLSAGSYQLFSEGEVLVQ